MPNPSTLAEAEQPTEVIVEPRMKVWDCKIGEVDAAKLPPGCDMPMRRAVAAAFKTLTGEEPEFIFSGWGGQLLERERAVVENRLPDPVKIMEEMRDGRGW